MKNVKPQAFVKFNQALCKVCENLDLKIKAANAAIRTALAKNRDDLLKKVMCETDSHYYKYDCLYESCSQCGPKKIWKLIKIADMATDVEVRQWKMRERKVGTKTVSKKT